MKRSPHYLQTPGKIIFSTSLVFDTHGNLFVADWLNGTTEQFNGDLPSGRCSWNGNARQAGAIEGVRIDIGHGQTNR